MQRIRGIIFSIPLLTLVACTSTQPAPEAPVDKVIPKEEHIVKTTKVSSWDLSGALAAKSKNKNWTASLNWSQQGANNYTLRLSGPLSAGTVLITKKGSTVTYKEGDKNLSSSNADELLQKQTGIRLPVNNLYYWVRALPAPGGGEKVKQDEYNRTSQIQQAGYTVDYTRYTSVNGTDLPSMIRLNGNGVSIKLVIKQWKVS